MVVMLLFASINLTCSQAVVGDIPLKRVLTTPTFRFEVIIAKSISYALISVFQVLIVMLLLEFGFGIPSRSTFFDLFAFLWLTSLSGISWEFYFPRFRRTRLQASYLFLFDFIIMMVLVYEIRVPAILPFIPVEHAHLGYTNLAQRGMTLLEVWPQVLGLIGFCGVIFGLTILYFQYGKRSLYKVIIRGGEWMGRDETTKSEAKIEKNGRGSVLWGLVVKEIRLLLKDKMAMFVIFLLPFMLVVLVIIPIGQIEVPPIGYVNLDRSSGVPYNLSSGIVDIMKEYNAAGTANFIESASVTQLDEMLGKGQIYAYIVLPDGLEYNVSIHFPGFLHCEIRYF